MDDFVSIRIYCADDYRIDGELLYKKVVELAKDSGLSGASVFRAIEGFGSKGAIRGASLAELFDGLPIVVEIIDKKESALAFLEKNRKLFERVRIFMTEVKAWR